MLRIFIGYDERQPVSYNVLQHSIITYAKKQVAIIPLRISHLPINRTGLTPFTYSRFLVPYLCDFEGSAIFLDADMLLRDDIWQIMDEVQKDWGKYAVWVTKNKEKFEWASVMVFDCAHPANSILQPEYIEKATNLHTIGWLQDDEIGSISEDWNFLVGYDEMNPSAANIHFTQGVPAFPETKVCDYANIWNHAKNHMNYAVPWATLMGPSVHAVHIGNTPLPKFLFDLEKQQPKPEYEAYVRQLLEANNGNIRGDENEDI